MLKDFLTMRLREYIISLPSDLFDDENELCSYAIDRVREDIADDWCSPTIWEAWVISEADGFEIDICVTRLSHGGEYPRMKSGYCYVSDDAEGKTDVEIYTPNGTEGYLYQKYIDHKTIPCNVWLCADGRYRAQLCTLTGV